MSKIVEYDDPEKDRWNSLRH